MEWHGRTRRSRRAGSTEPVVPDARVWELTHMIKRSIALVVVVTAGASLEFPLASMQPAARRANLAGTVVVVNQQSDTVTLVDLKTMEAYRHVAVVGGPHEAAASPDGRSVLVTNYNKQGVGQQKTLSLLALPSGDTIKTIDLGEYRAPHDVRSRFLSGVRMGGHWWNQACLASGGGWTPRTRRTAGRCWRPPSGAWNRQGG